MDSDGTNLFYYRHPVNADGKEKAIIYRTPLDAPRKSDGSLDVHVALEYPARKRLGLDGILHRRATRDCRAG